MKTIPFLIGLIMVIATINAAVALPVNYEPPAIIYHGNASGVVGILGYDDTYWFGFDSAVSNDLQVVLDDTIVNNVDHGTGYIYSGNLYSDTLVTTEYYSVTNSRTVRWYDVSNPLAPTQINSSGLSGSDPDQQSYFDGTTAFVHTADGQGYQLSLSGSAYTSKNFNDIDGELAYVWDTFSYGGEKVFNGIGNSGAIQAFVFYENGTLIMNVSASDASSSFDTKWYIISEDFGVDENGYLISLNGFTQYDTLSTRCGVGGGFLPLDAMGVDYIIGLNTTSGYFYICDASNLLDITLTNTGVYSGGTGGYQVTDGVAIIGSLYLWDLNTPDMTAAVCELSDGCYMNDTFSYSDSVLDNGWSGWGVSPSDGELSCFASTQYNFYEFPSLITPSNGDYVVEFDATICGDSTAYLDVRLGFGDTPSFGAILQGDAYDGTIWGLDWSVLTETIGDNYTDDGGWICSGNNMFVNNYKFVVHPQNTPRTFDIYINDELESQGHRWTVEGESHAGQSYVYVAGQYFGTKCFWYLDAISVYDPSVANLTDEEISAQEYQFGAFNLSQDNPGFDSSRCGVGENINICFMRELFVGLLEWFWSQIIKHPFIFLALIFLIMLLVFARTRSGR